MIVFVVIWKDRHCDDSITVHATREGADAEIERCKAIYADKMAEYDETWKERTVRGWERCVEAYDDGPRGHIEKTELKP